MWVNDKGKTNFELNFFNCYMRTSIEHSDTKSLLFGKIINGLRY